MPSLRTRVPLRLSPRLYGGDPKNLIFHIGYGSSGLTDLLAKLAGFGSRRASIGSPLMRKRTVDERGEEQKEAIGHETHLEPGS
jgi:hypothetical protein